ncbi:hypothetical protein ATER59S_01015 [Aquamicrobium terrae]
MGALSDCVCGDGDTGRNGSRWMGALDTPLSTLDSMSYRCFDTVWGWERAMGELFEGAVAVLIVAGAMFMIVG